MDDAFFVTEVFANRLQVIGNHALVSSRGDAVRDWVAGDSDIAIFPYNRQHSLVDLDDMGPGVERYFWALRTVLGARSTFGGGTYFSEGRPWYEWHQLPRDLASSALTIAYAEVATHNHFVLDTVGKVFNRTAPVIKLSKSASENEHLSILGVLNSSTACFWLMQNSHNKGEGGGARVEAGYAARGSENWRDTFQFTSTTLLDYPLPPTFPQEHARTLNSLAIDVCQTLPKPRSTDPGPTMVRAERVDLGFVGPVEGRS